MSYICPACGEAANYSVCEKCGGWGKPQPPISHSGRCGLAEHEAVFAPNAELASLRARVAELEAAVEVERRMNAATRLLLPVTIYMGREHCFGTHSGYELGFAPRDVIEAFNAASLAYEQALKGKQ